MPGLPPAFGLVLVAAGLLLFAFAWIEYGRRRAIADTPTSKALSMAVGPVELKGAAEKAPGLSSYVGPFSQETCLFYRYRVEEERTRTVTTHDPKGGTHTRTEHYWVTVASGEETPAAIGLRDESGLALVDLAGGDLPFDASTGFGSGFLHDAPPHVREFLARRHVSTEGWLGFNKTMRYVEDRLTPGRDLYAMGTATMGELPAGIDATARGLNASLIVRKEGRVPFILSTKTEGQLVTGYGIKFGVALAGGIALASLGAAVLAGLV